MDPLGFASSMVEIGSLAVLIQRAVFDSSSLIGQHENFLRNDLPTLIGFLDDIKNSFLNAKEQPPPAAESSLRSCWYYLGQLNSELHGVYGHCLDRKWTVVQRVRIQLRERSIKNAYRSFRASVLLLKDVCLFFMAQQHDLKQVDALEKATRLLSMTSTTQDILVNQYELGSRGRPDSRIFPSNRHEDQSITLRMHQHNPEKAYQDEAHDASLLRLQRSLQHEYPDKTVFIAVVCPAVPDGQALNLVPAIVLLDTGSDVNIVSEKYLIKNGLSHLVTEIPEDEQFEMSGIEEQGPAWKFKRKFTTRFYLYSSSTVETADFFVTKSSDFDILISQKQYAKMAKEQSSANQKLMWMPKKKRSQREESEQGEFEHRRREELENLRRAYDEREIRKRLGHREGIYLQAAGRAWTINDNITMVMPALMSGGSGEGSSSMAMDSIDEQSSKIQKEASIHSGTMEDGVSE